MICSRSAAALLLTTALCCAGCVSSLWTSDPAAHELEVVELSESQMKHGGFGTAGSKPADGMDKPAIDGGSKSDSASTSPAANPATLDDRKLGNDAVRDKAGPNAAMPFGAPDATNSNEPPPAASPSVGRLNAAAQNPVAQSAASNTSGQSKQIDSRQMLALLADLQSAGAIDAKTQQELLDDLKQTDPALWPQLIRQFRTALAYRQHMATASPGAALPDSTPPAPIASSSAAPAGAVPGFAGAQIDPLATMFNQSEGSAVKSIGSLASPGNSLLGPSITSTPPGASAAMVAQANFNNEAAAVNDVATAAPADLASNAALADQAPSKYPVQRASHVTDPAADSALKSNPTLHAIVRTSGASSTKAGPKPAGSKDADEWQQRLTESILAAESETAAGQSAPADLDRQLRLRFLYLAAGRRDDALRPIQGLPPEQQEFWTKELYGLGSYLDTERIADPERRATEAALHLHQAAGRLGEMASPVVHNLTFCKEVTSYGVFKRFPKYEFKPAEEVLLYCEIENLKSQSTDQGFHTNIKSSYQILDNRGERISEQEFPSSDDYCSNPRRDFFIPYFIALPKRINPGNYTLQLTVEDTQRNKVGQSSIQFTIK